MKILFEGYNGISQNKAGGAFIKAKNLKTNIEKEGLVVKYFDKWQDKISDFDILHIFTASSDVYSTVRHAKNINIPIIVSSIVPISRGFTIIYNKILSKIFHLHTVWNLCGDVLFMADVIIAETECEKKYICRYYGINPDKIKVIPNGINAKADTTDKSLFYKKTGISGKYVLQVGRFDTNKNQLSTIRAVKNTDIQLVLIGGPDKAEPSYYEICKKEAGENVHFLGWVDHEDPLLYSAYSNAHTVILPSHKEIFGNAIWEGALCGANVVVTNSLPIDEWGFGKYCLTINPKSYIDIQQKLKQSLELPKNDVLSNLVKEQFSWSIIADKHIMLYEMLTGENYDKKIKK